MERIRIRSLLKNLKMGQKSMSARNKIDSTEITLSQKVTNYGIYLTTDGEREVLYQSSTLEDTSEQQIRPETAHPTNLNEHNKYSFSTSREKTKKNTKILNQSFINSSQLKAKGIMENLEELGISKKNILDRSLRSTPKNATIDVQIPKFFDSEEKTNEKRISVRKILIQRKKTVPDAGQIPFTQKINSKRNIQSHKLPDGVQKPKMIKKLILNKGQEIKRRCSDVSPWEIESPTILPSHL